MNELTNLYAEMGRRGGQARSANKAAAARQNGRHGGRNPNTETVLRHAYRHIENEGAVAFLMEDEALSAYCDQALTWLAKFAKKHHKIKLEA